MKDWISLLFFVLGLVGIVSIVDYSVKSYLSWHKARLSYLLKTTAQSVFITRNGKCYGIGDDAHNMAEVEAQARELLDDYPGTRIDVQNLGTAYHIDIVDPPPEPEPVPTPPPKKSKWRTIDD